MKQTQTPHQPSLFLQSSPNPLSSSSHLILAIHSQPCHTQDCPLLITISQRQHQVPDQSRALSAQQDFNSAMEHSQLNRLPAEVRNKVSTPHTPISLTPLISPLRSTQLCSMTKGRRLCSTSPNGKFPRCSAHKSQPRTSPNPAATL